MPDDNRFAGLSDVVEEEDGEAEDEDGDGDDLEVEAETGREGSASTGTETDTAGDTATATDTDSDSDDLAEVTYDDSEHEVADSEDDDSDGEDTESDDDAPVDPSAFPFDATTKKTVYVRDETIDDLEDARALVDAQLRTEHDVRDLTGREFYDAVFRLAADDTDGLIEEIRDERAD
ncbi:hypothetical protein [Natronoglomus mannanivorans]|uniref:Uncharacterized protein n=1 Tax=Natronoglomus mannanivorans TaxID=2979990 RepID=A0AAP2YZZ3_9EURY|nr:hypothetical protein [Halobacteria archaeon AArc-xg1-1]